MITSIILSYLWWLIIPILLVCAGLSYVYIPVVGKFMAIALCSGAAALGAYELGYADRAKLDKSVELQAQLDATTANLKQAQQEALDTRKISDDAATREKAAVEDAATLQQKVSDYEKQLADSDAAVDALTDADRETVKPDATGKCPKIRQVVSCRLTNSDVSGLRAIRADRSTGRAARSP